MMPRYTHSETGALVALCVPCWMKLTPYLTRQQLFDPSTMKLPDRYDRPKATAIAAVERQF